MFGPKKVVHHPLRWWSLEVWLKQGRIKQSLWIHTQHTHTNEHTHTQTHLKHAFDPSLFGSQLSSF